MDRERGIARLYLPATPVGFQFPWTAGDTKFTAEIVGVVGNVLKNGNDSRPQPEYYRLPRDLTRFYSRFELVLQTRRDPGSFAPAIREVFRQLAPSAAVETTTLGQRVAASVEQPRFAVAVLSSFAMLALALAGVGLYGVLSYAVTQRRRELGVRAALGAGRRDLLGLVVQEGLLLAGIGGLVGLAAATALTRLMQSALFGVTPLDLVSFVSAPLLLLPVATLACLMPALRAASINPSEALRSE